VEHCAALFLILLFSFEKSQFKICRKQKWEEILGHLKAVRRTLLADIPKIGTTGIYMMEKGLSFESSIMSWEG